MVLSSRDPSSRTHAPMITSAKPHSSAKPVTDVVLTCKDRVVAVAFAPDSRLLASASADGSIQLWDVQRGQGRGLLPCDQGWPTALACGTSSCRPVNTVPG